MKSFALTNVGTQRKVNQDFVYASDQPVGNLPNLLIVADGMGGHAAGDYASRCAVETMVDCIQTLGRSKVLGALSEAVAAANKAILEAAQSDRTYEGMGTTVVAAVVRDDCVYIANVGDSRLYLIGEEIMQITRDHSLVEEMVRAGELSPEKARVHPDKNIITRAVGVKPTVDIDLFDVSLLPEDRILLCSDGLSNMVSDEEIAQIVRNAATIEEAAETLIQTANANGGVDNISVVLAVPELRGDELC